MRWHQDCQDTGVLTDTDYNELALFSFREILENKGNASARSAISKVEKDRC